MKEKFKEEKDLVVVFINFTVVIALCQNLSSYTL